MFEWKMDKILKFRKVYPVDFFTSTKKIIEQMTEVTTNHYLTPEISLRLVTPKCALWTDNFENCPVPDPYWAFYWPGGQALTRFLLDNPDIVRGKSVLDLGSGCGSVAIAAGKLGIAKAVTANDIDPVAGVAISLNASLNLCEASKIKITTDNFIGTEDCVNKFDCILLGDMFYNEEFNNKLIKWLLKKLKTSPNIDVYIGDPNRYSSFFKHYQKNTFKMAEYKISDQFRRTNDLTSDKIYIWKLLI